MTHQNKLWPAASSEATVTPAEGEVASYVGRLVNVLEPELKHYALEELGGLANVNRWGGRTIRPYSVAAHQIHVASVALVLQPDLPPWAYLACLLHDAPELYLSDVVSPLKHLPAFEAYRRLEASHANTVERAYDLPTNALNCEVRKRADRLVQISEAQWLVRNSHRWCAPLSELAHLPEVQRKPLGPAKPQALAELYTWLVSQAHRAVRAARDTYPDLGEVLP